jgi:hypothetical protein
VETLSGAPRLLGGLAIGVEDLVDDGQERPEGGLGPRHPATIPGGLLVLQDLLEGVPVQVILAARLALADLAGQHPPADLGSDLHVGKHSCLLPSGGESQA